MGLLALRSRLHRAKETFGIREGRIREDLALGGVLRLLEKGPRLVPFRPGFDLGFCCVAYLGVGVVLRTAATHQNREWRDEGEVEQATTFSVARLFQFRSPDEVWEGERGRISEASISQEIGAYVCYSIPAKK